MINEQGAFCHGGGGGLEDHLVGCLVRGVLKMVQRSITKYLSILDLPLSAVKDPSPPPPPIQTTGSEPPSVG